MSQSLEIKGGDIEKQRLMMLLLDILISGRRKGTQSLPSKFSPRSQNYLRHDINPFFYPTQSFFLPHLQYHCAFRPQPHQP